MKSVLLPPTTFLFPQTELGFQIEFSSFKNFTNGVNVTWLEFWKPLLAIVEQLNIKEFPSLMLKKPASQIVKLEEKEERWEEVVKPVENWGKIVTKWDIEVRYLSLWPTHLDFHY